MRLIISILVFVGSSLLSKGQENKDLLCRTWKLSKVTVNGTESGQHIMNDHLSFGKDMKFKSYDSGDRSGKYAVSEAYKLEDNGNVIIQNPGTEKETRLKIMELSKKKLVYQLEMKKSIWMVYMKAEK